MLRVLQFSTHNEECGIAKYQEQFIADMTGLDDFYTEFFNYSPNQTRQMSGPEFQKVLSELIEKMQDFDILHIQHELSFFKHFELQKIVDTFRPGDKKVIVTVHTAPHAQYRPAHLGGIGPRSIAHFLRSKISAYRFIKRYVKPLKSVDLIIIHNQQTKKSLMSFGISEDIITSIRIPVPKLGTIEPSHEIEKQLRTSKDDIIFCTVGFLSRTKGVTHAVKALLYLPKKYKLAIIGGNHPGTEHGEFYDEVCDLINELGLRDRVYITGYVKEDAALNALIRECDVCVYPFDAKYYSYVSSASLNNAFANQKAVIAYPTKPFLEINEEIEAVQICRSGNYYELARELKTIDIETSAGLSAHYAERYAYNKEAKNFLNIYRKTLRK